MLCLFTAAAEINAMLKAVGKESKFENGMRVTDDETIDIVQMVLAGKVNKNLVHYGKTRWKGNRSLRS